MTNKIAYLTGFFDGEGCVTITKNGSIQLRIVNTSKEVLDIFQEVFGGEVKPRKQKVNKPQYHWSVYGENAVKTATAFLEFSIEKKQQLQYVIEWFKERESFSGYRIKGVRGVFSNPERRFVIKEKQEKLTEMKKEFQNA